MGHDDSVGQGLCPGSAFKASEDDASSREDGKPPDVAFLPTDAAPNADHITAQLGLCEALAGWEPWSAPSAQLLQAMAQVQRVRQASRAAMDTRTVCTRRAEAMTELA